MADGIPRFERYRTYKRLTEKIADFLIDSSGYTPSPPKDNRSTFLQKVPNTRTYLNLTKIIVQSGPPLIQISDDVLRTIDQVICLRKKHTATFTTLSRVDLKTRQQNDSHIYFTSVLERVRDDLYNHQKRTPRDTTSIEDILTTAEPDMSLAALSEQPSVNYREERLEPGDVLPDLASTATIEEDMPLNLDSERQIAIDFFLDDLMEVRVYLREIWTIYKERRITLVTASLVTNFAIDILKRAVVDLQEDLSQLTGDVELINPAIIDCWTQVCKEAGISVDLPTPEKYAQVPSLVAAADRMCVQVLVPQPDATLVPALLEGFEQLGRYRPDASFLAEDELTKCLSVSNASDEKEEWRYLALQILVDVHKVLRTSVQDPIKDLETVVVNTLTSVDEFFHRERALGLDTSEVRIEDFVGLGQAILDKVAPDCVAEAVEKANKIQISQSTNSKKRRKRKGKQNSNQSEVPKQAEEAPPPYFLYGNNPILCGVNIYGMQAPLQNLSITRLVLHAHVLSVIHLYNTLIQCGFLEEMWQDLEYVINVHTPLRLFAGSRPTKPEEFSNRAYLVWGVSAAQVAKNRGRWATTNPDRYQYAGNDAQRKRGFQIESPLMLLLRERYRAEGPSPMAVQNLSAYLVKRLDEEAAARDSDTQKRPQDLTSGENDAPNLGGDDVAASKKPGQKRKGRNGKYKKPKRGGKNAASLKRPDSTRPSKYSATDVLSTLTQELIKEELHMNFNYLALQHRCVELLLSIQRFFRAAYPTMGGGVHDLPPYMLSALVFLIMDCYAEKPESPERKWLMGGFAQIMKTLIMEAGRAELDRLEEVY
ncbi:hypothetical protein BU16DRAFT_589236 [Lophium mytilinum]|uniref:DUF6604 domain-containing protein n=1 Tax=Lophium mytilinum TaxID=390894 RepID=A0A6A6QQX4_9PEZI|nr:hypothetical protein BU16DRAFT_589236 [Lophium mytilinum]